MNNQLSYYIQQFFQEYLPSIRNYSSNTIVTYKFAFLDLIKMVKTKNIDIENFNVGDFNIDLVNEFIVYLKNKNLKAKTINIKLSALKSFASFLQFKNLGVFESCTNIRNIKPLKEEMTLPEYYSVKEISYLLNSIDRSKKNGLKQLAILTILYDGALRVSELCNLRKKDVLFSGKNISIYIEKTKNKQPRTILLDENASLIVRKYLENYKKEDEEYLFSNNLNKQYTRNGIYKLLKRTVEHAKNLCKDNTFFKSKVHPHILRHSKATHMVDAGIDIIIIRDFLGHKSINSTQIYTHISKKRQEEILINNIKNKKISVPRTKTEKQNLESWLKNNL